ncbi:MAG: AI-2E family transporter [Acidimicrobiia bacterium]|jgi:predicted PurR-regulated permease PerM
MTDTGPEQRRAPAPSEGSTDPDQLEIRVDGRIIWQAIGAILLTLFLIWAVRQASTLVAMIAIAFFFGLALDPGVRWLVNRYQWRRGAAVGLIYVGGVVFATFLVLIMIPSIVDLARVIGERGSEWIGGLDTWLSDTFNIDADLGTLGDRTQAAGDAVSGFAGESFGTVLGFAANTVGFVFQMATIAMFTFYFAADMPRIQKATLRLFSPPAQQRIGWTWDQAIVQTGGYFYSRLLLMLINGLGFFFTMVLVGLPVGSALALALFGSFVSVFIPVIGTYIGGAVPVLLSIAFQGFTAGLIVLGYVLVYQQIENYWLSPRLSAKTMTLNGGVAFGAALAGGALAGPMGAFTALPIAALISSFFSNYLASHEVVYTAPEPPPKPSREHRKLSERIQSPGRSATDSSADSMRAETDAGS